MKTLIELRYWCLAILQQIYNWRSKILNVGLIGWGIGGISLVIFGADKSVQVGTVTLDIGWIIIGWVLTFVIIFMIASIRRVAYPAEKERILSILRQSKESLGRSDIQDTLKKEFVRSHARAFFLDLDMDDILKELVQEGKSKKIPSCDILEKPVGKDWGLAPDEWFYTIFP